MGISTYSPEEITEMSMIEVAHEVLADEQKPMNFYDLLKKVTEIKELTQEEVEERIAQFYTDLNIDGRFLCVGDNQWGLKHWYPYDQIDDDISQSTPKKKKSKKKKAKKKKKKKEDFEDIGDEADYSGDNYDSAPDENNGDDYNSDDQLDDDEDDDYDEDVIDENDFDVDDDDDDDEDED